MIAYVDASAAAKALIDEPETPALKRYLNLAMEDGGDLFSSLLLETELRRTAAQGGASQERVTDALELFDLVEPDPTIFRDAGLMPGAHLRSLDAIHVVTALRVDADVFVTYDSRQAKAASAAGLRTVSPS
ncbi:MAG: type II toxin-antitoxin system VapC family toxin [Solirubrobacterales bacterium]|nr:type II toxin-antitoxin system VapC family toxin [Solirubrobacterales bacterium]